MPFDVCRDVILWFQLRKMRLTATSSALWDGAASLARN
jgi:hypothetical protein